MRPISILFTNNTLAERAGSEVYVRDVALALQRRGHRPMAFSLVLGAVAAEIRAATIPVVDDVTRIRETPDVIHGHHHVETLIAALAFPQTPIVHFCHGWVPWEELPLLHPSVRHYIAVDEVCLDRLHCEEGIASERIDLLLNFVDLDRFRPRPPLPQVPRRALVLSNAARGDGYARVVAAACESAGIALDIVGTTAGNPSGTPETLLPGYDLVFAKGRTALEAVAVGCATVLADWAGAGPLVTPDNYDRLRRRNFGIRELQHAHDAGWYGQQIANYSASGAAEVSRRARADAGMEPAIDRLLAFYEAAIAVPAADGNASEAAARHVMRIARPLKEAHDVAVRLQTTTQRVRDLESSVAAFESSSRTREATTAALERQLRQRERELEDARHEARRLREEIETMRSVATLRIRDAVLNVPVLGAAMHAGARRLAHLLRS